MSSAIAAVGVTLLSLYALHTGWRRYKEGVMPDDWNEHERVLIWVNLLNLLLQRRRQERLTARQIRIAGIFYMLLGGAGLAIALVQTWRMGLD